MKEIFIIELQTYKYFYLVGWNSQGFTVINTVENMLEQNLTSYENLTIFIKIFQCTKMRGFNVVTRKYLHFVENKQINTYSLWFPF